jgi:glutathione S-transferase
MKNKWVQFSTRFEAILKLNGGIYLVGSSLTYADILVAHVLTWFVEEVRMP